MQYQPLQRAISKDSNTSDDLFNAVACDRARVEPFSYTGTFKKWVASLSPIKRTKLRRRAHSSLSEPTAWALMRLQWYVPLLRLDREM